jgi:hypothetical protein
MDRFPFDTVLFPINFTEYFQAGFGPRVVERGAELGIGRLALKAMARQRWPEGGAREAWPKCWYEPVTDPVEASLALRFTLSQPITAAIPPGEPALFRQALAVAERFIPVTPAEAGELRRRAAGLSPFFQLAA